MQRRTLVATLWVAALAACGSTEGPADIAESASTAESTLVAPPGCPPDAGNTKGVGAPCTKGGGQCRGTGAPWCTLDIPYAKSPYGFCTKMCASDEACGPDATCAQSPTGPRVRGCVPNACLP